MGTWASVLSVFHLLPLDAVKHDVDLADLHLHGLVPKEGRRRFDCLDQAVQRDIARCKVLRVRFCPQFDKRQAIVVAFSISIVRQRGWLRGWRRRGRGRWRESGTVVTAAALAESHALIFPLASGTKCCTVWRRWQRRRQGLWGEGKGRGGRGRRCGGRRGGRCR